MFRFYTPHYETNLPQSFRFSTVNTDNYNSSREIILRNLNYLAAFIKLCLYHKDKVNLLSRSKKYYFSTLNRQVKVWVMIHHFTHATLAYHVTKSNTFSRWLWKIIQNPFTLTPTVTQAQTQASAMLSAKP